MINWWSVWCIWRRNALVWQKLAIPSLLGNVLDPVMALMAFGLGLGAMIAGVNGEPYLNYLAVGAVSVSAMNAATFESLYSAFSRMHVQKTWDAILNTPVGLNEIVLGEWIWAASKSGLSVACMMTVIAILGVGSWPFWLIGWFVLFLAGLIFAGMGLCINAKAPGFDFFMFYFTLAVTPMTFLSGAFFPRDNLPAWLAMFAEYLPLSVVVDAMRLLYAGKWEGLPFQLGLMLIYAVFSTALAIHLTRKRFNRSA